MKWGDVREHYKRLFEAAKKTRAITQATIAARGGVRQNDLSRMFKNTGKGPQVETFINAVIGLGMPLSEFFRRMEDGNLLIKDAINENAPPPAESVADDDAPQFESEERIAQNVLRKLTRFALEGGPRKHPAHHRLHPEARPLAAERHLHAGAPRPRNVPSKKKKKRP